MNQRTYMNIMKFFGIQKKNNLRKIVKRENENGMTCTGSDITDIGRFDKRTLISIINANVISRCE